MEQYHENEYEIYEFSPEQKSSPTQGIFFAHANAIPALTYKSLLQKIANTYNVFVVSYDMRGIGKTNTKEIFPKLNNKEWTWDILTQDHIHLFNYIKNKHSHIQNWILSGHSLGAWLSLLSAQKLNIKNLILLDPPILPPNYTWKWSIISLFKQKHLSPMSKKVKRRKTKFQNHEHALQELKKSPFMKNWSQETIQNYIEGSFVQTESNLELQHKPEWEAHLFEEYPALAAIGFLKLKFSFRKELKPIFFVGEKSNTCYPKAKNWVKLFFPNLKWILIPNGEHMFPIEMEDELVLSLKNLLTEFSQ